MNLKSVCATLAIALSLVGGPAFAGDPFRTSNPRDIDDNTEAAIEAIFREGNYPKAETYLKKALETDANEPLVYAIAASLAYSNQDWQAIGPYAAKIESTAENLLATDPLRGNLYLAMSNFLEGAYIIKTKGPIAAINKLQPVLEYLAKAEAVDPNDPELNLFKGYMELLLAVNLPFASPEQAIANFQNNAAPEYVVNRGIALAYRDLKQYDKAKAFVETALAETPNNPELQYLKAQILYHQGKKSNNPNLVREAIALFDSVIQRRSQLPQYLHYPLEHERRVAQTWLDENT